MGFGTGYGYTDQTVVGIPAALFALDATGEQIRAAIRDISKYGYAPHNLLLQSQALDATWVSSRCTITANATTAPDGTLTADKLIPSAVGGTHRVYQPVSKTAATLPYTISVYAKSAGNGGVYDRVRLVIGDATEADYTSTTFYLNTGTFDAPVNVGAFVGRGATMTLLSNGWYRLTFSGDTDTESIITSFLFVGDSSAGDGTSGAFLWGAQLNLGPTALAYVPTTSTALGPTTPGFLLPGTAGARINASARSSVAMERQADGTYAYAPHNLLTYSEDFSNAAWVKQSGVTVSGDTVTATTADTGVYQAISTVQGSHRVYVEIKAGTATSVQIGIVNAIDALLLTWTTLSMTGPSSANALLEALEDGWYRLTYTYPLGSAGSFGVICKPQQSGTTVRIRRAGFARAPSAGYIPTTSAAVYAPAVSHDGAAWDVQCEAAATNQIRNSAMVGAATGSPGTLPTNWIVSLNGTLGTTVTTGVTMLGLPAIDLRIQGTASADFFVRPESLFNTVAASGQAWTSSHVLQLIDGTSANCTPSIMVAEYTDAGVFLAESRSTYTLDATIKRVSHTRTLNNASTQRIGGWIYFSAASGAVIDMTIRIACPQLETGSVATSPILTYGSTVTRAADDPLTPYTPGSAGAVIIDYVPLDSSSHIVASLSDGTSNERHTITNDGVYTVVDGGATQASPDGGTPTVGALNKVGIAFAANDFAVALNGASPVTDVSGTLPTVTQLSLAGGPKRVRRIRMYATKPANLQGLTA